MQMNTLAYCPIACPSIIASAGKCTVGISTRCSYVTWIFLIIAFVYVYGKIEQHFLYRKLWETISKDAAIRKTRDPTSEFCCTASNIVCYAMAM